MIVPGLPNKSNLLTPMLKRSWHMSRHKAWKPSYVLHSSFLEPVDMLSIVIRNNKVELSAIRIANHFLKRLIEMMSIPDTQHRWTS